MSTQTVEMPQYIRKVKLSEARKRKYYELGKKLPVAQRYADRTKYDYKVYNKKSYLVDLETDERVVANPRAAGTPRYATINGQAIYNGGVGQHMRNKIMSEIKASFKPYIDKMNPITDFPLVIEMELHDVIRADSSGSLWDLDNRSWPYIKAFQDCLTGNKDQHKQARNRQIIPDDNILFITGPPVPKFIPVDHEDDRKLVFRLRKETDSRILNHTDHKLELKRELDEFNGISGSGQ